MFQDRLSSVDPKIHSYCYMLRMGRWQKMSEPVTPDGLHFSAQSCRIFGKRYFENFVERKPFHV